MKTFIFFTQNGTDFAIRAENITSFEGNKFENEYGASINENLSDSSMTSYIVDQTFDEVKKIMDSYYKNLE